MVNTISLSSYVKPSIASGLCPLITPRESASIPVRPAALPTNTPAVTEPATSTSVKFAEEALSAPITTASIVPPFMFI